MNTTCARSSLSLIVPIPHRKVIRTWLRQLPHQNSALALSLVALDLSFFLLATAGTVMVRPLALKFALGVLSGLFIARLFILGHDACHQSFTTHRRLNAWIGRIVFLPSLTPYSLWDVGHNVVHHGYTNLRGFDMVWHPCTLEEYLAMPEWRRTLERLYRSGLAPWLNYLVEIWWKRMYFPSARYMPTRRRIFVMDSLLVTAGAATWMAALAWAAGAGGQSIEVALLAGFVTPFLVWCGFIGFVVYVHHTHPDIAWYADKTSWATAQPFVSTTVHLVFRPFLGVDMDAVLHHIMQHTAHHVDMTIPLYRLPQAQAILEAKMPGRIVVQQFSWRWYFDTARRCKLYDYSRAAWTDFNGRIAG